MEEGKNGARTRTLTLALLASMAALVASCAHPSPPTSPVPPGPAPQASSPKGPAVWVVATGHSLHLKESFGYSLADLHDLVVRLRPELVCAEVDPADHGTARAWMYPLEVAVVEHAARHAGATFWPSDWRPEPLVEVVVAAEREMSPEEQRRFEGAYGDYMPRFQGAFGDELFAFFHSPEALALIRAAHEAMIRAGGDAAAGFWDARNQMIVKRCMREARRRSAQRVVFVFGGDHKYGIEEVLEQAEGVVAEPVVRGFERRNREMAPEVVEVWRRTKRDLERTRAAGTIPSPLAEGYPMDRIAASLGRAIASKGLAQ